MAEFIRNITGQHITHTLKEGPVKIVLTESVGHDPIVAEVKYDNRKVRWVYDNLWDAKLGSLMTVLSWLKTTTESVTDLLDNYSGAEQ
jgi:hypothetical protein